MKSNLVFIILVAAFLAFGACIMLPAHSTHIKKHAPAIEQEEEHPADGFRERAEYEFNLLKDPSTGTIPEGTYAAEWAQALATEKLHVNAFSAGASAKTTGVGSWSFAGPGNLGGRTRAIGIDVANSSIILAGNISGGITRTTNGGASWTNVTPAGNVKNVSSIAQDTRAGQTSTWYFCTGEGIGNSAGEAGAFYTGNGVYKSTDNGITWSRLSGSNGGTDESFDDMRDINWRIAVDPTTGYVYLAATNSIWRSADGGTTWTNVLGQTTGGYNSSWATDIVITTGGRLYAAFSGAGSSSFDGVWTSTTGALSSWTRIANSGLVTGWNAFGNYGRVVLALAPSDQTKLFALYWNNITSNCAGTATPEAEFYKYDQSLPTPAWTNLSANLPDESGCLNGNDPFACQTGYDLSIAVKPDDANTIFIGGTNVYRSTSGFTNTTATTRIGGYVSSTSYGLYSNHHPDIQELKFASSGTGFNDMLYTGDDGGIQKADITQTTPAWTTLNNNYPSYQYYHVALDPTTGSSLVLGGAQDNGTTTNYNTLPASPTNFDLYFGGDGASVGMDAAGAHFYFATQNGNAYRDVPTFINIQPASNKSLFVTNFHLDPDNTNNLYYANGNDLYRTGSATTVTTSSGWTLFSGLGTAITTSFKIYGIASSRGAYSTNTGAPATLSRLYVGTNDGRLFRIDDPLNFTATGTPPDVTPTSMNVSGNTLVAIAVDPADSRKVMAVYSNYGINSAWYTPDASIASPVWTNVEGNISAFSFRSVVILSNGSLTNYLVGTSKGIYSTATLNGSSTVWSQEASATIGYLPVPDIAYRRTDQTLLAGTHGNGMFFAANFPLPLRFISFDAAAQAPDRVSLMWTVSGAEKIANYVVQRSTDGQHWQPAATTPSNSQAFNSSYNATDNPAGLKGTIYYRIRATEANGDGYYSAVVPVHLPDGGVVTTGIYPTSVSRYLNIDATGDGYTAVLTDMQGRRLAAVRLTSGKNNEDLSMLPPGNYIVTVYSNSGALVQIVRIVKQ